jgi:predicted lactoylglutathione lyase
MAKKIFVNLPIESLNRSVEFFSQLGFTFNKQFTNEHATCMIISEDIYAMLLTKPFFQGFIANEIADTHKVTGAILALSVDSRAEVDALTDKALKAGAKSPKPPQDHGFMYQRSFKDLDGHHWEIFWMDPAHVQPAQS